MTKATSSIKFGDIAVEHSHATKQMRIKFKGKVVNGIQELAWIAHSSNEMTEKRCRIVVLDKDHIDLQLKFIAALIKEGFTVNVENHLYGKSCKTVTSDDIFREKNFSEEVERYENVIKGEQKPYCQVKPTLQKKPSVLKEIKQSFYAMPLWDGNSFIGCKNAITYLNPLAEKVERLARCEMTGSDFLEYIKIREQIKSLQKSLRVFHKKAMFELEQMILESSNDVAEQISKKEDNRIIKTLIETCEEESEADKEDNVYKSKIEDTENIIDQLASIKIDCKETVPA